MEILDYCARYAFNKILKKSNFKVDKIIVFDESDDPLVFSENVSTHMSICDIKQKIALERYRIEVRFTAHNKKYRALFRHDDDANFPIRKELGVTPKHVIREANIITHDDEFIDVTRRIKKYAGQNGDFDAHAGCTVYVKDMFPFHDIDLYKVLLIETTKGDLIVFNMNDVIAF